MARDYSRNQTYYEILVHFKHGSKKYTVSDKPRLDDFLSKTIKNDTVISYTVTAVSKFIYVEYENKKYRTDNRPDIDRMLGQLDKFKNLRESRNNSPSKPL